jgi:hypothetical protein
VNSKQLKENDRSYAFVKLIKEFKVVNEDLLKIYKKFNERYQKILIDFFMKEENLEIAEKLCENMNSEFDKQIYSMRIENKYKSLTLKYFEKELVNKYEEKLDKWQIKMKKFFGDEIPSFNNPIFND